MKKLTIDEVRYLHGKGLINPELIAKFKKESVWRSNTPLEKDLRLCFIMFYLSAIIGLIVSIGLGIMLYTEMRSPSENNPLGVVITIGGTIATVVFLIIFRGEEFVTSVNELQTLLHRYINPEHRLPYYLHLDTNRLKKAVHQILMRLSAALVLMENHAGKESQAAQDARTDFKTAHEVFRKFGLCEPDQGIWTRNPPPIDRTLEPVAV